jgi:hypothetical protein
MSDKTSPEILGKMAQFKWPSSVVETCLPCEALGFIPSNGKKTGKAKEKKKIACPQSSHQESPGNLRLDDWVLPPATIRGA